jgi:hypothetical protein
MPIQALTPAELKVTSPSTSVLEYEEFLRDCAPGHGGGGGHRGGGGGYRGGGGGFDQTGGRDW